MQKVNANRKSLSSRRQRSLSTLATSALISLVLLVPSVGVKAQVGCLAQCEQDFAICLNGPTQPATCLTLFERCTQACIDNAQALLLG